jgi:hypothetical protein
VVSSPVPHVRSDAVDHYWALLADNTLPTEALCLTVVRGLDLAEALRRFDACAGRRSATLAAAGEMAAGAFPNDLPLVVADRCGDWVLLAENNGFHGSLREVLARLSSGTVAASVYWNVNMQSSIGYAEDGKLLAAFDFVISQHASGADRDRLAPFLDGLHFANAYRKKAEAMTVLERVSGVRVSREWLRQRHPASVVVPDRSLGTGNLGGWLWHAAPTVAAVAPDASRPALRAATTFAVTSVFEATGTDDPTALESLGADPDALPEPAGSRYRDELLNRARETLRQGLELRWDRLAEPDVEAEHHAVGGAEKPVGAAAADDPAGERDRLARAHALAAAWGRLVDDPHEALRRVLVNVYRADQQRWPDVRDQVNARLRLPAW